MVLSKLPALRSQHRLLISLFARAAHLHNIPSFNLFRHACHEAARNLRVAVVETCSSFPFHI